MSRASAWPLGKRPATPKGALTGTREHVGWLKLLSATAAYHGSKARMIAQVIPLISFPNSKKLVLLFRLYKSVEISMSKTRGSIFEA